MKHFLSIKGLLCLLFISFAGFHASAQYNLVWADEFDGTRLDSSKWNVEKNIGIWNTGGNRELEHYRKENVTLADDGSGNKCLIITAKKESYNGYSFTSGKIDTRGKFSVKYGKIEARIKMPNSANGLWPGFWLLGYTPDVWPKCGEIDVAELGMKSAITAGNVNKALSGALHWDNNGAGADYGKVTALGYNMNDDYHVYQLVWTKNLVKMYIDGVEYYAMTTPAAEEFNTNPYFIIFNLAVGGMFPDIYSADGITCPIPGKMMIDYIRVYQQAGEGEINATPNKVYSNFGVYDETSVYNFKLDLDADAKVTSSGLTAATKTPFEGTSSLSYTTAAGQDFNLAIEVPAGKNMLNYLNGSLQFKIKTNFTGDLKIGVSNSETGGASTTITSTSENNFERNNNWVNVVVPISSLLPSINYEHIVQLINISGVGEAGAHLEIDKVFWSETVPSTDKYFGLFTENPNISNKIVIDNTTVNLYIWENTLTTITNTKFYEGKADLSFKGAAGKTWFGYGIASTNPVDLTAYKNGSLHLTLKTSASNEFWLGIGGANKTEGKVTFPANAGKYGFARDGKWHTIEIPMSDLLSGGLDLSGCGNVFMLGGVGVPSAITVDDVYLSTDGSVAENPAINPETPPVTSVKNSTINEIVVLPNPASDYLYLKGAGSLNSVEILDITGKCLSKQVQISENEQISISGLTSGMYFVRLNGNNQSQVLKFMKK